MRIQNHPDPIIEESSNSDRVRGLPYLQIIAHLTFDLLRPLKSNVDSVSLRRHSGYLCIIDYFFDFLGDGFEVVAFLDPDENSARGLYSSGVHIDVSGTRLGSPSADYRDHLAASHRYDVRPGVLRMRAESVTRERVWRPMKSCDQDLAPGLARAEAGKGQIVYPRRNGVCDAVQSV